MKGFEMPKQENEKRPLEGDGFVMKGKSNLPETKASEVSLEFRPGESTEKKIKETKIAKEEELERVKDFTPIDYAEEFFADMLEHNNSYSETFLIKETGQFDKEKRLDGSTPHMQEANTPEELYQIAKEIKKRHPEYEFSFENDKYGKWIKYTVSKNESGK